MITISHFHFALIIVLVGVFSVAVLIAILEILGREAIANPEPEPEMLCPDCHLLFTKSGQSRAVATGHCLRCEAKEILSAAKDVGERERRARVEKHFKGTAQ